MTSYEQLALVRGEVARLRALNRKLVKAVLLLLAGGSITWVALLAQMARTCQ